MVPILRRRTVPSVGVVSADLGGTAGAADGCSGTGRDARLQAAPACHASRGDYVWHYWQYHLASILAERAPEREKAFVQRLSGDRIRCQRGWEQRLGNGWRLGTGGSSRALRKGGQSGTLVPRPQARRAARRESMDSRSSNRAASDDNFDSPVHAALARARRRAQPRGEAADCRCARPDTSQARC